MIYEAGEYHLNDGQMTFLYLLANMFFFFFITTCLDLNAFEGK